MKDRVILTEHALKMLSSFGGISGIIALITIFSSVSGFVIVKSNLNYLGLGGLVRILIDEYLSEGSRFLLVASIVMFLSAGILQIPSYLQKLTNHKIVFVDKVFDILNQHKLRILSIVSILCFVVILMTITNSGENIVFHSNSNFVDAESLDLQSSKFWFYIGLFLLVVILKYVKMFFDESIKKHRKIIQVFGSIWMILFILLLISYGKNLYHREFLLIDNDITFSDSIKGQIPQNNLLLIHDNESKLILFQFSERKIYQIQTSSVLKMSFTGEKRVVVEGN